MEKVKITQEQADAIEVVTIENKEKEKSYLVNHHVNVLNRKNYFWSERALEQLSLDDLILALYIGYEVEPEFKIGDWLCHQKGRVAQVKKFENGLIVVDQVDLNGEWEWWIKEFVRHATPEEVKKEKARKEEKTRRWWESNGRKVREYREGDLFIHISKNIICEVTGIKRDSQSALDHPVKFKCIDGTEGAYQESTPLRIVCFAQDRKDI